MKALALVVLVAACVPQPLGRQPTELHLQRERAQGHRVASGIGLAIGIVAAVAGGLLFAHATDVRSREPSADHEDGLGTLLGGTMLLVGGSALTIGSGVVLAVSNHEYLAIDQRIRRLEGGAK